MQKSRFSFDGGVGPDLQPRLFLLLSPGVGELCLLRMGGMRPEAQQSFSLGWVVVRSKKAAAEKGAVKIPPKRKSSVSPYRCMFECALSAQMEQLHEVL